MNEFLQWLAGNSVLIGLTGGIAGLISLAVTFWFGQRETRIADHQLFISVARDVHERYSRLYPVLASLPKQHITQLTDEQQQAISQYVNLCAEEYLWKQKGIVQREIWEVWEQAIRAKFSHPVIRAAWKQNYRNDKYYKGFVEFIDEMVK
jgi:hypothetical protein